MVTQCIGTMSERVQSVWEHMEGSQCSLGVSDLLQMGRCLQLEKGSWSKC